MIRPNDTTPLWKHIPFSEEREFDTLTQDIEVDVAIIGGGITGITAACLLKQAGKNVAVFDLGKIGGGTTSSSSGHLASLVDTWYYKIEEDFSPEEARKVAASVQEAHLLIEQLSSQYKIDCDFKWVNGYLYTEKQDQTDLLRKEQEAAARAGLEIAFSNDMPLPFPVKGALRVSRQAQFHPYKYISGLAERIHTAGCAIYENTIIRRLEEGSPCLLETDTFNVRAEKVIIATHMPISAHPVQAEIFPYISYCVAIRTSAAEKIEGLFTDTEDPYHYIRDYSGTEGRLLIIGGMDHKTGHESDTMKRYEALEAYVKERFPDAEFIYRWSGQYYKPADGLPYIGYSPFTEHTLIGTGYSGDGLSWGTVAAKVMSDLILERENPYTELYSATRLKLMASAKEIFRENADIVRQLIADRFSGGEALSLKEIKPGDGKIIQLHGRKLAVYRDDEGNYYAMSPVCHHLGCVVHWNTAERTWDCPCHGSRFDCKGKVMYAPVLHNLDGKDIEVD
jgi:glycine/D-amino acid oxidase-like deaminating enzyme/nitrite reductase/ring-hydroxylating ferredoxin subunit